VKIQSDKVTGKPPHALTEAELRRVMAALPPEWVADVSEIRLSNALDPADRTYFHRPEGILTVYSRGRTRQHVIGAIFTELAAYSLGFKRTRWQRITEPRLHRINQMVGPLTEKLLATFPKPKPNPIYPRPIRAPYENVRNG
jgi:hypothetical protein